MDEDIEVIYRAVLPDDIDGLEDAVAGASTRSLVTGEARTDEVRTEDRAKWATEVREWASNMLLQIEERESEIKEARATVDRMLWVVDAALDAGGRETVTAMRV